MLFYSILFAFLATSRAIACAGDETCGISTDLTDCTLTQGFWKTHYPQAWPQGWANATICGTDATCSCTVKLEDLMLANSAGGNSFVILGRQYAAALLNLASGACTPTCVDDSLAQARTWLLNQCNSATIPSVVDTQANTLATFLDWYNNGTIGNGHCGMPPQICYPACEYGTCGCTYTQGAWYNKFAQSGTANSQGLCQWPGIPAPSCLTWDWLSVASPTEETELCEDTWWEILGTAVGKTTENGGLSGNWLNLAHQWIAATLNFMNGACGNCPDQRDYCADIWLKLQLAYTELNKCRNTIDWSVWEPVKNDFDSFNNGVQGVSHCADNDASTTPCDSTSSSCPSCKKLSPAQAQNMAQRLYEAGFSVSTAASSRIGLW